MKTWFTSVVSLCAIFFSLPAFSFQDKSPGEPDSLTEKTVRQFPNVPGQKIESLGRYVAVVDDSTTFRLSYGLSVLNTVRGRVPNTGISVHAPFASVRQNALLVIDGLTYVQSPSNFYNMNAFDYDKLSVISRNAAAWYGIDAAGGAFLIKSKTGEGHERPAIEFNSSMTSAYTKSTGAGNFSQSYFSNAIAYMQDFGKIDTRISYNYLAMPSRDNKSHNIKINTGINLSSKFRARLIIDRFHHRSFASSRSSGTIITDTIYNEVDSTYYYEYESINFSSESETDRTFTQGNLMLEYNPVQWLTLSSQGSLGRFSESIHTLQNGDRHLREDEQNRSLANVFATIRPDLGRWFSLSTMIGVQYSTSAIENTSDVGHHLRSYKDKYYLSGLNLGFRDYLFANYTFRADFESSIPDSAEKPAHLFSVAFAFSDAFGWQNAVFSNGRIRATKGRTFIEQNLSLGAMRRPENFLEVGTDLSFAGDIATFTLNYFKGKRIPSGTSYQPGTGYWASIVLPESGYDGFEVALDAVPLRRKKLEYQTTLLWTRSNGDPAESGQNSGIHPNAWMNPIWAGSFLNRITFRNFLITCLMVVRTDDFLQYGAVNKRHTQIKMRDLTFGYNLSNVASRIGFRQAHIALSARNPWLISSTSGKDVEAYAMPEPPNSMSLNLYLLF